MNRSHPSPPRDLLVGDDRRHELRRESIAWPSWTVAGAALADLEALVAGWLWPLDGYRVVERPPVDPHAAPAVERDAAVTLDVSPAFAADAAPGVTVALRDPEGVLLAALHVDDRRQVDGTWRLAGRVEGLELPAHDEFGPLRLSPAAIADRARALGRTGWVAYFPGALLHAGTRAALLDHADRLDAAIVVLIPASSAGRDDFFDVARIRALVLSAHLLPADRTVIGVVPIAGRADDRPTLARAALAAASCGAAVLAVDVTDNGLVTAAACQDIESQLGIAIRTVRPWGYSREAQQLVDPATAGTIPIALPPAPGEILKDLAAAPRWLLSPAEVAALERAHPPREAQGFTVFLTGLSGSGKSTIGRALRLRLMERTGRPVTLLDGDLVRRHLSSELGFSREHRDLNILRIGWVAAEIVRHGGIAICTPIAPYDAIRQQVRQMVEAAGGFLLVHVATPLETCEARDRKGLYAKARAGLLPNFTGVSDPYEAPRDAALVVDTRTTPVDEACALILARLTSEGYLVQES